MTKNDDLSNLITQNVFVKIHAKAVSPEMIYLKGSLKIHMPFDIFVGYVQENPPISDLIKTYASVQCVTLEYKIQREAIDITSLPKTLFEGSCLPRSSLSQISSPTTAFVESCLNASKTQTQDSSSSAWLVEYPSTFSRNGKPFVRFSDPVYTGLFSTSDNPLPQNCSDNKYQMSQRCLNYEFDLTCPIPNEEDPWNNLLLMSNNGRDKYSYPLFLQLSLVAYCTRHDSEDSTQESGYTVPYAYVTPPLNVPLLPEHASSQGSMFSLAFSPYLFALEVESLQRTIEEIDDFRLFSHDMCWGIKDVPMGLRVQAGL